MKNETVVTNGTETAIITDEDLDLIKQCIGTAVEEYKILSDDLYYQLSDADDGSKNQKERTWCKNRIKYYDSVIQRCQTLLVKLHMVEKMWQDESLDETYDAIH